MKKIFTLLALVLFGFTMIACGDDDNDVELPETIEMTDLDDFLFDPEWQFVDLRNFDDQFADGWIRGFEMIPFFQYLEYEEILIRTDGWDFDGTQILNESALRELFDEDKNIVLICAAGVRAAFVKEALESLGYENVWNAGALGNYVGDHRVFGDGSFNIDLPPREWVDPLPEVINMDNIDSFLGRPGTKFIDFRDVYHGQSAPMLEIGWIDGFTVIPYFGFLQEQGIITHPGTWDVTEVDFDEMLDSEYEFVLRNIFGDEDTELVLMCMSGARSGMMMALLDHLGYTNLWNAGGYNNYEGTNRIAPFDEDCDEDTDDDTDNGDCQ